MAELVDAAASRVACSARTAAPASQNLSRMRFEQSTASVEKLVGKPPGGAAKAHVLVLGVGLPAF